LFATVFCGILVCDADDSIRREWQAMETQGLPQTAFKYDVQVMEEGRVELYVPIPAGAYVTVVVIPESTDTFNDLLVAAESSLGFWDNPYDDEDWNNA